MFSTNWVFSMSVPRRFTTEDGLLDTSVLQRVMMILFDDGEEEEE